jgi:hypothetical protein
VCVCVCVCVCVRGWLIGQSSGWLDRVHAPRNSHTHIRMRMRICPPTTAPQLFSPAHIYIYIHVHLYTHPPTKTTTFNSPSQIKPANPPQTTHTTHTYIHTHIYIYIYPPATAPPSARHRASPHCPRPTPSARRPSHRGRWRTCLRFVVVVVMCVFWFLLV